MYLLVHSNLLDWMMRQRTTNVALSIRIGALRACGLDERGEGFARFLLLGLVGEYLGFGIAYWDAWGAGVCSFL